MRFPTVRLVPLLGLFAGCRFMSMSEFERIGEVEARTEVGGARRLVIRNTMGEITLRTDAEATVTAKAVVYHKEDGVLRRAQPEDLRVAVEGDAVIVENAHLDGKDKDDWKMSITISAPPGLDLKLAHGVGDCDVAGAFGEVSVDLGVGELELRLDTLRSGRAHTGVGELDVAIASEGPKGEFTCGTGVGDLAIAVPASFGGEVSLGTGVGSIDVENASGVRVEHQVASASARGRIGDGSARLTGKTGTGSISFRRR